jgi:large subunit ribosomal protein L22
MEAKATKRYIPSSPRKMRLVVDLVRGKTVENALNILHFNPKHASDVVEMTIKSAVSNLSNKIETGKVDDKKTFVKEIFVDVGPTLRRIMPATQGRAYRVRKRSNHLTVIIAEKE